MFTAIKTQGVDFVILSLYETSYVVGSDFERCFRNLNILRNYYGYTHQDILKTYWQKWQKNMQRIGKEWN